MVSEWVWDEAAATRWAALKAELKAAQVARQIVRDSEDPVARRLVDNWCSFSVEHMYEFAVDGEIAAGAVGGELRGRDQLEELSHTEALSELMRSEVAGGDQNFMAYTRLDDTRLIVGFRDADDQGSIGWWWSRRPVDGDFADYFDQLAP